MSCPPWDEFQIGWICALRVEAAAAKEMLDEKFEPLDGDKMPRIPMHISWAGWESTTLSLHVYQQASIGLREQQRLRIT